MIPLQALSEEESLLKGPFPEPHRDFGNGMNARELAARHFSNLGDLLPALMDAQLYVHQMKANQAAHKLKHNVVVATGTASGKTECFLYPILFELFRQHLEGTKGKTSGC